MNAKTIVIIGGTSGIGQAAVRHFLKTNNKLVLLYRNESKLQETLKGSDKEVITIPCDLYSFNSMKKAIESIKEQVDVVDVLISNAGMWEFGERKMTENQIETTFQVNVLAPCFFKEQLTDLLKKSENPRVITTASALHIGTINFADIEYKQKFSGYQAYRQSKLAVVLLTRLWAKQGDGIQYFSFHPGVVSTELGRSAGWLAKTFFKFFGISPEKGAQTLIYLIESPKNSLISGEYYAKNKLTKTSTSESYNLETAKKMEEVVETYLARF